VHARRLERRHRGRGIAGTLQVPNLQGDRPAMDPARVVDQITRDLDAALLLASERSGAATERKHRTDPDWRSRVATEPRTASEATSIRDEGDQDEGNQHDQRTSREPAERRTGLGYRSGEGHGMDLGCLGVNEW